jgi:hypothetical protein
MKVIIFKDLGVYNEGRDNIDNNLILCVNDEIKGPTYTYTIIDLIGKIFYFKKVKNRARNFWASF